MRHEKVNEAEVRARFAAYMHTEDDARARSLGAAYERAGNRWIASLKSEGLTPREILRRIQKMQFDALKKAQQRDS